MASLRSRRGRPGWRVGQEDQGTDCPGARGGRTLRCIGFHSEALVRLAATRAEVEEVLGMAVYMGGGPSLMYAADAIVAFEQFQEKSVVPA